MVFKLTKGFQKRHCNYLPSNFKNKNGIEAKNDDDNASNPQFPLSLPLQQPSPSGPTVLNSLPQHAVKYELGITPTTNKIKRAIASMAYDKAPGQSGLATNMIKLTTTSIQSLCQAHTRFLE